ncbi:MAG TPA: PAS domain S-box protein [Sphingomicrobium sp.]|nr:PAS domain S-box protein [Sphingomicrobium sp.]
MSDNQSASARSYLFALLLVLVALVARIPLQPLIGDTVPYMTFFLAVVVAGAVWGARPGIVALVASGFAASFFVLPPHFELSLKSVADVAGLIGFFIVGGAILYFIDKAGRGLARELETREAMLASETREHRLIDAAQDYAIYELDREGRILTWNKGAERLKGWKASEIIGKPYNILHTPESRATNAPGRELKIAAETGRFEEEAPRMRKDGTIFAAHVSLFPLRDERGDVTGFVKVTRDISDGSKVGKAILESRRRMEAIVQSAMDAIITIDEEQRVVLFNPAAEKTFGLSADEILGESVTLLLPQRYRARHGEYVRTFFESGVVNRRLTSSDPLLGLRANGEEFPIEASISQVTVGGERVGTIILRDITERKTNEEARALLAREVDHRAKNALAVAQALVSLTKADTVDDFSEAIRGRIASLGRAHSLLSQSQWRGAPLDQLIRDEILPYAKEGQLSVKGPKVSCSAGAVQSLSLLIHELATNAVKYGALGSENGHLTIGWHVEGEVLRICWKEEGGPPVHPPKRRGFGTKLLNQVSGRQLNASLQFDWNPKGLYVEIDLPADTFVAGDIGQAGSLEPSESSVIPKVGNERRILLVEDEELVALELGAELSRLGWTVVGPAATLNEAQALLSKSFDAAVLDVNLRGRPVYAVAEALEERHVPFLFCTGYEMVDPEGRFPHVPVIRKPAHPAAVSAALADLLKQRAH